MRAEETYLGKRERKKTHIGTREGTTEGVPVAAGLDKGLGMGMRAKQPGEAYENCPTPSRAIASFFRASSKAPTRMAMKYCERIWHSPQKMDTLARAAGRQHNQMTIHHWKDKTLTSTEGLPPD